MDEKIAPMILQRGRELLQRHRDNGDTVLIITATNRFVTAPIAEALGVEHLIATEPQIHEGRYTGEVVGTPCFQEGKVICLKQWLLERNAQMGESWFYSDSHNDIPLMSRVDHPVAVDPDETLARHAEHNAWPIISLR